MTNSCRKLQFDALLSTRIMFIEDQLGETLYHAFVWSVEHGRFVWHEDTNLLGEKAKAIHYERHVNHPTLAIEIDHDELKSMPLYNGFKSWLVAAGAKV